MSRLDKIAAQIRALRAKTVANGCTEDEAIAAAAKAAELLERHNLTVDEVELRASPFMHGCDAHEDEVGDRLWKVADGIAHLTGARYWSSRPGVAPVEIHFFGFAHEVEIARYLLDICAGAMRQRAAELGRDYALLVASARRRKILPFLDGMADRLRQRLRALKPPSPVGRGLIVLRDALIDAELAAKGFRIGDGRGAASRDLDETYQAGRLAADAVSLNQGIATAAPRALIA